ncbi:hypothetical protein SAMN05443572_107170 [Myxococcus fulvus]|uniref:Uncharacterized protein n=1 Tax=Myxococcus fulvus TaxID=33 RepID=A0A511T6X5_MYXFU|nr:hypothetical protein MFU01_49610 [Myxococcus fulvus]SEU25864.1 hypothetical protein SAMN05443572_107170 [Myxococcus fulvus]
MERAEGSASWLAEGLERQRAGRVHEGNGAGQGAGELFRDAGDFRIRDAEEHEPRAPQVLGRRGLQVERFDSLTTFVTA